MLTPRKGRMSALGYPSPLSSSRSSPLVSDNDLSSGPVLLSKAMTQRPLNADNAWDHEPQTYTFADLANAILHHNIQLPSREDELEDVGSPDVPDGEQKPPEEMTEKEIAKELAAFEREMLTHDTFLDPHRPNQSGLHEVWSVNDRRARLGHDPAQTINHLHGRGEIIYHYPDPAFRLLDLPKEVQDRLMLCFAVEVTGGRPVRPYQYQAKKPRQGSYRPLARCISAFGNSKDPRTLRLAELGRLYLYTKNTFTFASAKDLLRFMGAIGWSNLLRLDFARNIRVSAAFYQTCESLNYEMLWLRKWESSLKALKKAPDVSKRGARKPSERTLEIGDRLESSGGELDRLRLWKAMFAINQVSDVVADDNVEKNDVASAVKHAGDDRKIKPKKSKTRIRTLDLGGPIADIQKSLEKVGMDTDKEETILPYPFYQSNVSLYTRRPKEWVRQRSMNKAMNGPGMLIRDLLLMMEGNASAVPIFEDGDNKWKLYAAWAEDSIGLILSEDTDEDEESDEAGQSEADADSESDMEIGSSSNRNSMINFSNKLAKANQSTISTCRKKQRIKKPKTRKDEVKNLKKIGLL